MKNPDDGTPNRKSTLLGCGCLLSPFLLILGLFLLTPIYNNFRLQRFERNFAALPHPTPSQFIKRQKAMGLIAGNGNHCDFFVAELRSHSQDQQKIRDFYNSARVAVPNCAEDDSQDVKDGTQAVEIEFLPSPLPPNYRWKYHHVDEWNLSNLVRRKNLYVVLIRNSGTDGWVSMCDIRCN